MTSRSYEYRSTFVVTPKSTWVLRFSVQYQPPPALASRIRFAQVSKVSSPLGLRTLNQPSAPDASATGRLDAPTDCAVAGHAHASRRAETAMLWKSRALMPRKA